MFKAKAMGIELASTDLEVMHKFMDIWKRGDGKLPLGFHYKEVDEYYIEKSHIWVNGVTYGVFNCEARYYTCIGRFMTRLTFKFIEGVLKDCFKDKEKERRKTA